MRRTTVAERAKENGGRITGAQPMMSIMIMGKPGAKEESESPPNLRDCGSGKECCATCQHYGTRSCTAFNGYPVSASDVCDHYTPAEVEEEEETEAA